MKKRDLLLALALGISSGLTFMVVQKGKISSESGERAHRPEGAREPSAQERVQAAMGGGPDLLREKIETRPDLAWRFRLGSAVAFLLISGALSACLRLIICLLTGRKVYQPLGSPPPPVWSLQQVVRFAFLLVLLGQGILLAEWAITRSFHLPWLDPTVVVVANTFFIDLAVLMTGVWLLARRRGDPKPSFWAAARFAAVSYGTFIPVLAGLVILVAAAVRAMGYEPAPQEIFTLFFSESRSPVLAGLLLLAALIGPIAEEIFFRGLLYGGLRNRIGVGRALVLTAFLFACLHTDPVSFLPIFALGLLFGWVYEKTGSLAAPVAIHVLHNGVMLYAAFLIRTLTALA